MDVVLIILGVLGLGAIVISAYVFTVAARNYVSEDELQDKLRPDMPSRPLVPRSRTDRRSGEMVQFPLTVNGVVISEDRRRLPDRRQAA